MVTINDVARRAGVSISTVSHALSGARPISEPTKRRIMEAIAELGYRPNKLATSLVSRRSETIAVVASRLEAFGPVRSVIGIEQQAGDLGYQLLLNLLHVPDDPNPSLVLDDLVARRVDGIIWAASEIGENRAWVCPERLKHLPPIVFLGKPREGVTTVSVDNAEGARLVTQHLIDQGRRKIGVIAGPLNFRAASERYSGWEETLIRAGLEADPLRVVEGDWTAAGGARAARTLLAQAPDIDAIFAHNDQMALGALSALAESGRRVPDDIALVGFDNTPESEFFQPPLTTVATNMTEVGRTAVLELHRLIEAKLQGQDPGAPIAKILPPELIVRTSSGAR